MISRLRGRGLRRRSELSLRYPLRPWSAARILTNPHLRRGLPGLVVEVRRAVLRTAGISLGAIVVFRRHRRVLALVGAGWVGAVTATWRGSVTGAAPRPTMPPGRLTDCPEFAMDPRFLARGVEEHGPVYATSEGPGVVQICVAGLARGRRLLMTHRDSLAPPIWAMDRLVPGHLVRHQQGRTHRRYRAMMAAGLDAAALTDLDAIAAECAAVIVERLCRGGASANVVTEEVVGSFQSLFFGFGRDGADVDEVLGVFDVLEAGFDAAATPAEADAIEALDRLVVAPLRAGDPRAQRSVIGLLAAAGHDPVGDPTLRRNLMLMSRTTALDTASLSIWIVWFLAHNPEALEAVARGPGAASEDDVVSETLRLAQSEYVRRRCVGDDVRVDGHRIPRDAMVRILVGESHRDPTVFERPREFDPERFARHSFGPNEYAPFGLDGHACVGEAIVRSFGTHLVRAFAAVVPVRVVDDGPVQLNRWQHWAPSDRFRLRFGS